MATASSRTGTLVEAAHVFLVTVVVGRLVAVEKEIRCCSFAGFHASVIPSPHRRQRTRERRRARGIRSRLQQSIAAHAAAARALGLVQLRS